MIPVNTHPCLVRLSRSSINIVKRSNQRIGLGASSNTVSQKRTFISIVNPDAPRIARIRKSAEPKIAEALETDKVLRLRNFLGNPKPAEKIEANTEHVHDVESVAKTFTEAIQLAPDKTGLESPEAQTLNKQNVSEETETSRKEAREEPKRVEKDDIGLKTEAPDQNQEDVIVENETNVDEEEHRKAVKEETSVPVSQEDAIQNKDEESDKSDDETDSSSDSDSSSESSSSSDSESDPDNADRDDLARERLDQVNTINLFW